MFTAVVLLVATLTLLASALPSVRLGSGRAGASISLAGSAMLVAGLVLAVVATVLAKLPIRATTPPYPPMLDGPTRPLVPHTSPPLFGATP